MNNCKHCGGFCPTGTLDNGLCSDCYTEKRVSEIGGFRIVALQTIADELAVMQRQPDNTVYIQPENPARANTRWQWVRQYHAAHRVVSRETFATAAEARAAAADIARCTGSKLYGPGVAA